MRNRNNIVFVIALAVPLALGVAAAAIGTQPLLPTSESVIRFGVDGPVYHNLHDLTNASPMVAVAQVVGTAGAVADDGPNAPILTAYDMLTLTPVRGQPALTFKVYQNGGTQNGYTFVPAGDPLLKPGEVSLYFLRPATTPNGEPISEAGVPVYVIVGMNQGRHLVQDGNVYSLDTVDPDAGWIPVKFNGQPLPLVIEEVMAVAE